MILDLLALRTPLGLRKRRSYGHAFSALVLAMLGVFMAGSASAEDIAFCVRPGDSVEQMKRSCADPRPIIEHTEDGAMTSYVVSAGPYTATVVPEDGVVYMIRFNQRSLPFPGVKLGDRYSKVRSAHKEMELMFGWEEAGYLALGDKARRISIVFDLEGIPEDWSPEAGDESALGKARVVSINWVR